MKNYNITDQLLEQYVLGELPEETLLELNKRMRQDETFRGRVEALKKSNRDILNLYPSEEMSKRIQNAFSHETQQKEKKGVKKGVRKCIPQVNPLYALVPSGTIAAVVLVLLFVPALFVGNKDVPQIDIADTHNKKEKVTDLHIQRERDKERRKFLKKSFPVAHVHHNTERMKGLNTNLYIYLKRGEDVVRLKNGQSVKANDLIQVAYSAAKQLYGMIVSIDGRGNVTVHHPADGLLSARLNVGREVRLTKSFQLDDAPRYERFFFIVSENVFIKERILNKVKEMVKNPIHAQKGKLQLGNTFKQISILLVKGE